ncbi:MAG: hypothetical protein ABH817_00025, partial [archaeon]
MRKKAQEEMMGLVIIVAILVIVGAVFLGFNLRQRSVGSEKQSQQAEDILFTMLAITTDCEINTEPASVKELIKEDINS